MAMSLKGRHKCIERNLESDCPICGEYMFTSTTTVIFMVSLFSFLIIVTDSSSHVVIAYTTNATKNIRRLTTNVLLASNP